MITKMNPLLTRVSAWINPLLAGVALLLSPPGASAQLATHWNIWLTDFGYSDFLLDNTPGFEGREYLCGEWGGAVGYTVGSTNVAPQWFEPHFSYPDWTTDSQFGVKSPLAQIGLNADNLPIAQSIITNSHLQVTLHHEMIDTIVGIPMGQTPASAGGGLCFTNVAPHERAALMTVRPAGAQSPVKPTNWNRPSPSFPKNCRWLGSVAHRRWHAQPAAPRSPGRCRLRRATPPLHGLNQ